MINKGRGSPLKVRRRHLYQKVNLRKGHLPKELFDPHCRSRSIFLLVFKLIGLARPIYQQILFGYGSKPFNSVQL